MQVVLVMFRSDGERRSFSVVRNMTVIGRREDCDLRIPVGDVSRKHCRILTDDDQISIEDLGSSNGTFVNHQRVQKSVLAPGDTIGVGPVQFVVQIDGVPSEEDMLAPTASIAAMAIDEEDSAAGYQAATVDEEPPVDQELLADQPSHELAAVEGPSEDLPAEELPVEELTDADEVHEPKLTESLEELQFEEKPAVAEEELEPLEELEATLVPKDQLEELSLEAETIDADGLEALELDEVPTKTASASDRELEELLEDESPSKPEASALDELEELEVEDVELDELPNTMRVATHNESNELVLPPLGHAKESIEELDLDETLPAGSHGSGGGDSAGGATEGSAWDFVIEETEAERSPHKLHVDLDAPHQQPHQ